MVTPQTVTDYVYNRMDGYCRENLLGVDPQFINRSEIDTEEIIVIILNH